MKVFVGIKKKLKHFKENYEVKKYVGNSKYFDEKWYVNKYNIEKNILPYKHYYEIGWKKGFNPSLDFNTNEYLKNNKDVISCPLFHYEKYRKKEIYAEQKKIEKYIKKSKYFDEKWYVENYNIEKNILPHIHYYETGYKKGYNPSIYFDTNKYLKNNSDVDMCPLYHYEKYGKKEGRQKFFVDFQYDHNYKVRKIRRFIKRKISNVINFRKINKNKDVKILVYAHIFYVYSVPEIIEYLKNLGKYNYDLVITCTDNEYYNTICKQILEFKKDTKIIKCKNRGFDVGPFMEMLYQTDIDKYDVFFKLQSKGTFNRTSYIYNQIFKNRDWFEYMFESTLGAFYIHKNIDILSNDNNIGIVAASNLIITDPIHKKNFTIKHLAKKRLKLSDNYYFVAGTVFAERISLLKEIKKLNFRINDFESTETGYFSFAHALERYITANIGSKYIIYGNKVCKFKRILWSNINRKLKKIVGIRMLDDDRINLSDDFVLRYIEHTPILKYEIVKVKLGDLNVYRDNKYISLDNCYPYLFIKNDDEKEYIENCLLYRRTDYMDLSFKEFEKTVKKECVQRYRSLMSSVDKNSLIEKELISVNENNSILDGQHRACYLLHKHGADYQINVLKIYEGKMRINDMNPFFNKYE